MQSRQHEILFGLLSTKLGLATPREIMNARPLQADEGGRELGLANTMVANGTLDGRQRAMLDHMVHSALAVHQGASKRQGRLHGPGPAAISGFAAVGGFRRFKPAVQ